ncbi:MFS transporter [Brevibacterium sp. 5221]|uniref:MFS transporter n=1 Tax=Brevibacterium rongguiense TaxID=2695267 RepID=A0A6N9HBH5_9MICO|nr:MFS transporter [Brevibacterium rongguiense]MYM20912.1 MFS transporter [Brevibacterium rongguiense]
MATAPSPHPGPNPGAQAGGQPDPQLKKRTMRKVALRLAPFLGLLYFVNYLDRTNIGFAGPNGMNEDLGLTATTFGLASGLFFIGYLILEVPSNLALHKFGARRWIARILVTWGIVASLIAFVPGAGTLYILRLLLGIAEAGFFPGIILYLTFWFPKADRARAVALFMLAIPLSSVIGAPLSALLIQHGHDLLFGLAGWRFMFLIEGVPAVLLGFMCWFYLTDRPRDAAWLEPEERDWLQAEMDAEEEATATSFHVPVSASLRSGRIWALSFVYFGVVYGLYAISFFLPTIIAGFQERFGVTYTIMQKGLLTAIPFVFAAVLMLVWARHGDRTRERVWHVVIPTAVAAIVIPITTMVSSPFLAMVCVSIFASGVMCALACFWPLPTAFLSGAGAASGVALINSVGNTSGFFGPYITGFLADKTGSQQAGMWAISAALVLAIVLTLVVGALPKRSSALASNDPAAPEVGV